MNTFSPILFQFNISLSKGQVKCRYKTSTAHINYYQHLKSTSNSIKKKKSNYVGKTWKLGLRSSHHHPSCEFDGGFEQCFLWCVNILINDHRITRIIFWHLETTIGGSLDKIDWPLFGRISLHNDIPKCKTHAFKQLPF